MKKRGTLLPRIYVLCLTQGYTPRQYGVCRLSGISFRWELTAWLWRCRLIGLIVAACVGGIRW